MTGPDFATIFTMAIKQTVAVLRQITGLPEPCFPNWLCCWRQAGKVANHGQLTANAASPVKVSWLPSAQAMTRGPYYALLLFSLDPIILLSTSLNISLLSLLPVQIISLAKITSNIFVLIFTKYIKKCNSNVAFLQAWERIVQYHIPKYRGTQVFSGRRMYPKPEFIVGKNTLCWYATFSHEL